VLAVPDERDVLRKLNGWADADPCIRAVILTSSRARPEGPVDALSDYDVILALRDVGRFTADDRWLFAYGTPMVRWTDEHELYGMATYFRGVVYTDGVKVDYTLWPEVLMDRVADAALPEELDVGYRVLLDKDGRTAGWPRPTYRAHIPSRPTRAEYEAAVEEFWWGTTYAAKSLWRGELAFAKFILDYDIKLVAFRRLLEWRIELDHDWSIKPGAYGRGLERLLPREVWRDLAATYVGIGTEANWEALFRLSALFRRVAAEVGDALGFTYPRGVDESVSAYLDEVRHLPHPE
jgi:aminoglycoside 6-adenylyltransferase